MMGENDCTPGTLVIALCQRSMCLLAAITCVLCSACLSSTPRVGPDCPDELLALWEIPAGWLDGRVSPEQAHRRVLGGNLPMDGIRERWQSLEDRRRQGDQYWSYARSEQPWINAVGAEEGVVLIRECRQVGFVATSLATEGP